MKKIIPLFITVATLVGAPKKTALDHYVAKTDAAYAFLKETLTCDVVAAHMAGINTGAVRRFEADNLRLLNFLLSDSLGGGGSASLLTDAQGKTHGLALLRLELDVPDEVLDSNQV